MRTKTYFIITIMIKAIIVLVLFSSCDNDSEITNTVSPTFSPNYTATPYNNSEKSTKKDVENEHKHDYAKITENTATCMENGIMTYTCECGKQYTATKEQNWNNWETDRKATTTSTGLKTRNCITCQKSESQIVAKTKTVDLNKITPIDLSKVYEGMYQTLENTTVSFISNKQ